MNDKDVTLLTQAAELLGQLSTRNVDFPLWVDPEDSDRESEAATYDAEEYALEINRAIGTPFDESVQEYWVYAAAQYLCETLKAYITLRDGSDPKPCA